MRLKRKHALSFFVVLITIILFLVALRSSNIRVSPMRLVRFETITNQVYAVLEYDAKFVETYSFRWFSFPLQIEENYWRISGTNRTRVAGPEDAVWISTNDVNLCFLPLIEGEDYYQLEYRNHRRLFISGKHIGPHLGRQIIVTPLIPGLEEYTRKFSN